MIGWLIWWPDNEKTATFVFFTSTVAKMVYIRNICYFLCLPDLIFVVAILASVQVLSVTLDIFVHCSQNTNRFEFFQSVSAKKFIFNCTFMVHNNLKRMWSDHSTVDCLLSAVLFLGTFLTYWLQNMIYFPRHRIDWSNLIYGFLSFLNELNSRGLEFEWAWYWCFVEWKYEKWQLLPRYLEKIKKNIKLISNDTIFSNSQW